MASTRIWPSRADLGPNKLNPTLGTPHDTLLLHELEEVPHLCGPCFAVLALLASRHYYTVFGLVRCHQVTVGTEFRSHTRIYVLNFAWPFIKSLVVGSCCGR
jgi:hypothetical protein